MTSNPPDTFSASLATHFSFQLLRLAETKIVKIFCFAILFSFFACQARAQADSFAIKTLSKSATVSLRGLSVVNDNIIWASGSKGTVARSTDGGASWQWLKVPGFDSVDFRDIEAFSAQKAIIMGIASPACILLTNDGGRHWQKVYQNIDSTIFLDGMAWLNNKKGFAYGDPQHGKFFIIKTTNGGNSWRKIALSARPKAFKGEASFAASGTAITTVSKKRFCIATGGDTARLLCSKNGGRKWQAFAAPILQGKSSTGIFSLAFEDKDHGIIVGGDYAHDQGRANNCFITTDGGRHWQAPLINPFGYRSCVVYINSKIIIATGTSGTDVSFDAGMTWERLSRRGFNVIQKAKNGSAVFLAGAKGTIARLIISR